MSTELNTNLNISTNHIPQAEGVKKSSATNLPDNALQRNLQVQNQTSGQGKTEKLSNGGKDLPSSTEIAISPSLPIA